MRNAANAPPRPNLRLRLALHWARRSLVARFLMIGGAVSLLAILAIGAVVTTLIQNAVTRNAAATTALYVDSVIAPLLPNMLQAKQLDFLTSRALDETLGQGALGTRLAKLRLWAPDRTILYATDTTLIGRRFPQNPGLARAFAGELVANFDRYDSLGATGRIDRSPVLKIYNPIRQPWSGEVVAVIEFHEFAHDLQGTLRTALLTSWTAVAATVGLIFAALFATVLGASRTIDKQAEALGRRVAELTELLHQNQELHRRVQHATQRSTAANERFLRRLGADLHDGPAQLIALASLRLDTEALVRVDEPRASRERELASVRSTLQEALREIRSFCHGLILPQIETQSLVEIVSHAVDAYEQRSGASVTRNINGVDPPLSASERISIYRFLSEALNNGFRHCRGAPQSVTVSIQDGRLEVRVSDDGPGFDPARIHRNSLGLSGLRDRVESLGGCFTLDTGANGTTLTMELDLKDAAR